MFLFLLFHFVQKLPQDTRRKHYPNTPLVISFTGQRLHNRSSRTQKPKQKFRHVFGASHALKLLYFFYTLSHTHFWSTAGSKKESLNLCHARTFSTNYQNPFALHKNSNSKSPPVCIEVSFIHQVNSRKNPFPFTQAIKISRIVWSKNWFAKQSYRKFFGGYTRVSRHKRSVVCKVRTWNSTNFKSFFPSVSKRTAEADWRLFRKVSSFFFGPKNMWMFSLR